MTTNIPNYTPNKPIGASVAPWFSQGSDVGGAAGTWASAGLSAVAGAVVLASKSVIASGAGVLIMANNGKKLDRAIELRDTSGIPIFAAGLGGGVAFTGVGLSMAAVGALTLQGSTEAATVATIATSSALYPLFLATCGLFLLYGAAQAHEASNFRSEFLKRKNNPEELTRWLRQQMEPEEYQTLQRLSDLFGGVEMDNERALSSIQQVLNRKIDQMTRILGSDLALQLHNDLLNLEPLSAERIEEIDKASYMARSRARYIMFSAAIAFVVVALILLSGVFTAGASVLFMGLVSLAFFLLMDSKLRDGFAELSWDLPSFSSWLGRATPPSPSAPDPYPVFTKAPAVKVPPLPPSFWDAPSHKQRTLV